MKGLKITPKIFSGRANWTKKVKFECKMPTSDQLFQVRVNKN